LLEFLSDDDLEFDEEEELPLELLSLSDPLEEEELDEFLDLLAVR